MNTIVSLALRAFSLFDRVTASLSWLPPLVARLTVGVVFAQSGWGKLHDLEQVTAFFAEIGIPWPELQAPFASATELVCGALLVLGLGTRLAAVPLVVTMVVAIRTALWDRIDGFTDLVGLLEFAYIALLLGLAVRGAGAVSADAWISAFAARRGLDAESPTPVASPLSVVR